MKRPKLRDSSHLLTEEPYIINELPENIIIKIAGYFVYLLYIGRKDIAGSDWGGAFSAAIGGRHLDSPIGIADVVYGKMAWSMKTVKHNNPFSCKNIRLISGRCSQFHLAHVAQERGVGHSNHLLHHQAHQARVRLIVILLV